MGKGSDKYFSKEDVQNQQIYGKMLNITNHQGYANQNHEKLSHTY